MIKWISQHIVSLVARFRNDVYLEDLTTTTETNVLVVDSVGKISKSTSVAGDLTSIVAGTGLSGTGLTGPIPTLSVDAAQTGVTSLGTLSSLAVTSSSTIGVPTVKIDAQDADKDALYIDATDLTTGHGLTIASDAAKSNTALHVDGDFSGNADNASSVGIKSYWHKNSGLVSQQNLFAVGILSEMDDNAGNNANSAVLLTAFKGVVDSTSSTGNNWNTGLELVVTDGSLNTGILLNVENGGDDIKMVSNGDTGDYCTIATTTHGATTITTVDDDATAAHFEIAADGDITLDSAGQIKLEPVAGNNILLDGTIAVDAGVVTGATSITSTAFVGTLSTAAQPNVTSLGTLTSLLVDNIHINANSINTVSGDLAIVATGNNITVDTDNFTIESATSQKPYVVIKNTSANNKPSILQFVKDKGVAGAAGDGINQTYYTSDNDAQEQINMVHVNTTVADATDGAEEGSYVISIKNTNHAIFPQPSLTLTGNGAATDAIIGFGATSNTTVAGTLTMGSTAFASAAGVIQVATQGTIDHDSLANFVTAEHVDWAGSSAGTIHSSNYTNTSYGQANASTFGLVKHSATANNIVPQAVTNIASRSYQVNAGENSALTVNVPWTTPINIQGSSTSCTGNAATSTNLTASTSTAVGLGTIELGHATDTTVARSAAGTVTIEGDQIVTANVNKGKQVHINLRKNDNFLFYINTKTFWYSAAGYTYTYNNAASAGNFAMSFVRQTRMASYIAPYACKVKKIYLAAYYNTTATTAALDFEWAMHKWTPVNNSNGNATATLMTMTDRDGALAENKNHSIYWDITDNSASTMAAGDALGFAARCVDSSSASRQLWYGEAVVVVELI